MKEIGTEDLGIAIVAKFEVIEEELEHLKMLFDFAIKHHINNKGGVQT